MSLKFFLHDSGLDHDTGADHPERIARLETVMAVLKEADFAACDRHVASPATTEQLTLVHEPIYVDGVLKAIPTAGHRRLDGDTVLSPGSGDAALHAAGAAIAAVDWVLDQDQAAQEKRRAFVATRPPGHHAEPGEAMGFCLFNNIAIAARHAQQTHGLERVAVIDFDVHHGNGTQTVANAHANLFYASIHEFPLFPGTGLPTETGVANNVLNIIMRAGSDGASYRQAFDHSLIPALTKFEPQLVMISAGFDAHERDPLAGMVLTDDDFGWMTAALTRFADEQADGHVVSVLEGGYDLQGLAGGVRAHLKALQA
ncbi:MAG: histone deacetylase family protein [Pseudomonadota bacterium]